MLKKILLVQVVLLVLYGCATVPLTGRSQLNLVSNPEIIAMSTQQYQQVLKESRLSTNQEQTQMIKRVGLKIKGAVERYMAKEGLSSQLEGFNWEFNLIQNDTTANAWCMPGGKVAFYTGILPMCKDENGVAVVMGHEVAHAIANHGRERMSQGLIENGLLGTLGAALGENPTVTQQIFQQAVGIGAELGMLKFSRGQESEADHIGLIFLSIAGYDPNEAPKFWERMVAMSKSASPPEFLSTHPSDETRIADLKGWIPEAMKYKQKTK
jgi:predicted Zn-dependent protease